MTWISRGRKPHACRLPWTVLAHHDAIWQCDKCRQQWRLIKVAGRRDWRTKARA